MRRSQLNSCQHTQLVKFLVASATAEVAEEIAGIHRYTTASDFMRVRCPIDMHLSCCAYQARETEGRYFCGVRIGKRGRELREKSGYRVTVAQRKGLYGPKPNARTENLMPALRSAQARQHRRLGHITGI